MPRVVDPALGFQVCSPVGVRIAPVDLSRGATLNSPNTEPLARHAMPFRAAARQGPPAQHARGASRVGRRVRWVLLQVPPVPPAPSPSNLTGPRTKGAAKVCCVRALVLRRRAEARLPGAATWIANLWRAVPRHTATSSSSTGLR